MERESRAVQLILLVFCLTAFTATILYWIVKGWQIGVGGWPLSSGYDSAMPALLALGAGLLQGGLLLATGWLLVGRRANKGEIPGQLALWFLVGGAFTGFLNAWLAYGYFGVLTPIVAPVVAFGIRGFRRQREEEGEGEEEGESERRASWWILALVPIGIVVLIAALSPAVQSDGLRYHLAAPHSWLRAGHFVQLPYQAHSNLPALQGIIAGPWFGFEWGYRVYQVLNTLHFLALALVAGELAWQVWRSLGAPGEHEGTVSAVAAICTASVPVIAVVGSWPFSDVVSAAYLVAGVHVMLPGVFRRTDARLLWGSALLGAACSAKLSALPIAALAGLGLLPLVWSVARGRNWGMAIGLLLIPGMLMLGPWLLKSTLYHGNPVYPAGYGVFGGPEWSEANDVFYKSKAAEKGIGKNPGDLLRSPLDITSHWARFEGQNPGPLPLGLLAAAIILGTFRFIQTKRFNVSTFLLLLVCGGWVVWFIGYQSVRFLIPQIVFVIVLAVPLILWIADQFALPAFRAVLTVMIIGAAVSFAWPFWYWLRINPPYTAALGFLDRDWYIARAGMNSFPAVQWLNENTKENEPVFYIGEHRTAYVRNYEPIASDWFDTPLILSEIRATKSNQDLLQNWRDEGIRFVLMNMEELGLYEDLYFRPRFTDPEWERFSVLRESLSESKVFSEGSIYIAEIGIDS